jgi:chorismate synthase
MEILGGPLFGVAGAGESHGPAMTTIVFGCPPGLRISRLAVQKHLDRRRPGGNKHGTPRHEADKVIFLAGLYAEGELDLLLSGPDIQIQADGQQFQTETYQEGYSTGEPIAAMVLSTSKKSGHYEQFAGPQGEVRPGHTDLVKYHKSKGFVDIRGGGRSSYRSTISDVIGGSIARIFLKEHFGTVILSSIVQVGHLKASQSLASYFEQLALAPNKPITEREILIAEEKMTNAEIYSIDSQFADEAGELIKKTRIEGDSIGAMVEVMALKVPPLIGDPLYQSLKVHLMGLLGGLNAAQFCEIGAGREVISRRGSENNDFIRQTGYQTNNQGGMIGGITTGSPIVCRVGFKPTSTIGEKPQQSVRKNLDEIEFMLKKGRHDPCVGVRAGVTLESRMAIGLMNAVLMHQARCLDVQKFKLFEMD